MLLCARAEETGGCLQVTAPRRRPTAMNQGGGDLLPPTNMNEMHNEPEYITINEAMLSHGVLHRILDHNLIAGQLNI